MLNATEFQLPDMAQLVMPMLLYIICSLLDHYQKTSRQFSIDLTLEDGYKTFDTSSSCQKQKQINVFLSGALLQISNLE